MNQDSTPAASIDRDLFRKVRLGKSSVEGSRISLGLREIGRDPGRNRALILRATEIGIRHLDVAPTYGMGRAERRLGEALPIIGRDSVVISTKVGQLLRPPNRNRRIVHALTETVTGGRTGVELFARRARRVFQLGPIRRRLRPALPKAPVTPAAVQSQPDPDALGPRLAETCDYSYDGAMRGLEESLARLNTDRVDLVFIHDPDLHARQAMRGAYRALDELRRAGTIGAVGVGMNQSELLIRLLDEGDFDAFLIAGRYSLLDQSAGRRLFPLAAARGVSIILAGIFNGGILADPSPGAVFDYAPASDERLRQANLRKRVCDRHGVSIKAAALQFAFANPLVTSVLLGSTSVDELDESIRLIETPLPSGLWDDLKTEGLIEADVPVPG
jgi:D-threo-aldose 1-dehydrogenase